MQPYIRWFADLTMKDVASVGGKNASLGELVRNLGAAGVRVPDGFATTAGAYRAFLAHNGLGPVIEGLLERIDDDPVGIGRQIRDLIEAATIPSGLRARIVAAYGELSRRYGARATDVAVRSSATAEDLPQASFAGQQESFLNVVGPDALLDAVRSCFASLFTDRAIAYRSENGFDHMAVALSVGVQKMVRSDVACAGVMFTIDTESGFPNVVVIDGAWGLGEYVVKGRVTPDTFVVFKPLLTQAGLVPILERRQGNKDVKLAYSTRRRSTARVRTSQWERSSLVLKDADVLELARFGVAIEQHYGRPMDIEWAKDGRTGELFIVQARPETVHSQRTANVLRTYQLRGAGTRLAAGTAVGDSVVTGRAVHVSSPSEFDRFADGDILVTKMTDPDWGPLMRRAAAIVTDEGGRTCHAAIVAREYGVPAIVGTGSATTSIPEGATVTVSCAEGERGVVYEGEVPFEVGERNLDDLPATRTKIMLNVASPDVAFKWWRLPVDGIGLARMEFIISNVIKVHPLALTQFRQLDDAGVKAQIVDLTKGYPTKPSYFVDVLASGIAKIAASRYPDPVIVRMSDFKTNEYAHLLGGAEFEPTEANPMIGFRGAARYYSDSYREGFGLECRAILRVREEIGLTNVIVMIPFCRTLDEADRVLETMAAYGLRRGSGGLEVYVMAEIPSNVILAEGFADRFDGFSIGSNDLTQLVLGIDRDSALLAPMFDERNDAVTTLIKDLIVRAHAQGATVGICGQAPSDYPDFAAMLVEAGIDSISLNPDSVVDTQIAVAEIEGRIASKSSSDIPPAA